MELTTGLILIALGAAVWFFGNRMWLLGAGGGALLGYALVQLFPDLLGGDTIAIIVVIGMAVLFGIFGFMGKAFISILAMMFGFIIGGGLALSVLGMFELLAGLPGLVIALIVGVIVAGLFGRFLDWAVIVFASLLGAMLIVRGVAEGFPDILDTTIATVVVLVLTALGIFYHYRRENPST